MSHKVKALKTNHTLNYTKDEIYESFHSQQYSSILFLYNNNGDEVIAPACDFISVADDTVINEDKENYISISTVEDFIKFNICIEPKNKDFILKLIRKGYVLKFDPRHNTLLDPFCNIISRVSLYKNTKRI